MPSLSLLTNRHKRFTCEIALRAAGFLYKQRLKNRWQRQNGPTDVFLCLVDHFEPQNGRVSTSIAHQRMDDWLIRYPRIAARYQDADGKPPAHSFFYPWDEYDGWEFERLVEICAGGWGEIELHLHHRDDTDASLRQKFRDALQIYHQHGALSEWADGRPAFGFIHGNWALDNSCFDQEHNWCGVNNEIDILQEEGCYADFTFPAWQQTAQPRQINSIYFAQDDPLRPKSHDRGLAAQVGKPHPGLLLIQGPLTPFFELRNGRPRVGMDDGDLAAYRRYTPARLDRWVETGIHVHGRPDRVFVKLHTHGAPDRNREALLGEDLEALFEDAEARYNDGARYRLHYLSAREMYNVIQYTIADAGDDLLAARNYRLPQPTYSRPRHFAESLGR